MIKRVLGAIFFGLLVLVSGSSVAGASAVVVSQGLMSAKNGALRLADRPFVRDSSGCVHAGRLLGGELVFLPLLDPIGAPVCKDTIAPPLAEIRFVRDHHGCVHAVRELAPGLIDTARALDDQGYPLCADPD